METRKAQRQRRSVAEMIFQRSVQGARMVAFRKLKLFAETQAEARRQKDASMRIAYSLAVQSSDKNRSRNAMNTWLRFVRVRRLQRMQQAKERLGYDDAAADDRGRLAVAYRSLRMFTRRSRSAVRASRLPQPDRPRRKHPGAARRPEHLVEVCC